MFNDELLEVQRELTRMFIDVNPVTLELAETTRVETDSGGYVQRIVGMRDPQVFTIIEPGDSLDRDPIRAADGFSRIMPDYVLLGEWDAEMALDDLFMYEGSEFKITQMMHENKWERRARVERYGPGFQD